MPKLIVATLLVILSLGAVASTSSLSWHGYDLREVHSLSAIPADIQNELGVGKPGMSGVADIGHPFNSTDFVDSSKPMRRLLAAGQDGEAWLIALEQGGRGYNVQVYLFCAGQQRQHWVLLASPTTLHEVLQLIPAASQARGG
jgi:hypothetical protein